MAAMNVSCNLILTSSPLSPNQTPIVKASIHLPRRVTNLFLPGHGETQLCPPAIQNDVGPDPVRMAKLYAILEAVADRVEMHSNVGDQRNIWNSLLLTSINSITLAAAAMAGAAPSVALKLSSTVMYVAATGMLSIMNRIQPSQLAEEQRNAARLFRQLRNQIESMISVGNPTVVDVKEMMDRVLVLDKAYPLPLLGSAMIEKFPAAVEPAVWWPPRRRRQSRGGTGCNGWNRELEVEMREIVKVLKIKDERDYLRLGEKALNLNKFLAVTGPVLTGLAECFGGAVVVAVMGGALASVVNTIEQVGMVFEMYRSNAGFFKLMEEEIEANLGEEDYGRRENGEVFEMKVELELGRSLSQLRELAAAAAVKGNDIDEFASKLFIYLRPLAFLWAICELQVWRV